jgi:hypothetical protein
MTAAGWPHPVVEFAGCPESCLHELVCSPGRGGVRYPASALPCWLVTGRSRSGHQGSLAARDGASTEALRPGRSSNPASRTAATSDFAVAPSQTAPTAGPLNGTLSRVLQTHVSHN